MNKDAERKGAAGVRVSKHAGLVEVRTRDMHYCGLCTDTDFLLEATHVSTLADTLAQDAETYARHYIPESKCELRYVQSPVQRVYTLEEKRVKFTFANVDDRYALIAVENASRKGICFSTKLRM